LKQLKRAWNDPVWSKVIAGAILAALGLFLSIWLDWWPAIIRFARGSTTLPNWLLTVLVLAAFGMLGVAGLILWVSRVAPAGPRWRGFTEDVVMGLRWRWRYSADADAEMWDLHAFCPTCDFQLFPKDVGPYRYPPVVMYPCENCGFQSQLFDLPSGELESLVRRQVQRKIRSGEWKNTVPHGPTG
jgi:hypothetical protein